MRILVTGSEGTLGIPLVQELKKRGHNVFRTDLKHTVGNDFQRSDISIYREIEYVIEKFQPELVFNLAAEFGRRNGEEYYEQVWKSNVIGNKNLIVLQRLHGFRMIFASSSEVYGELNEPVLREDMVPAPQKNDYAISKWVNELQCKNAIEQTGNEIMILRFFNAYGPMEYYHNYRSVVCLFCYRALHDIPYTVYQGYHRVFMFVKDFIPTLANACERFKSGEIINVGGVEYRSVEDLSNIILKELGKPNHPVEVMPLDAHNVVNKRPDITKARELLGHDPKVVLEDGVVETLNWMKSVYKKEEIYV